MLKKNLYFVILLSFVIFFALPHVIISGYEPYDPMLDTDQNVIGTEETESEYYLGPEVDLPDEPITMELRNTDVRDILKYFATQYDLNIVIGEKVQGNITVSLKELPVREAFFTVLKAAQLGSIKDEDVLRIDTYQELIKQVSDEKRLRHLTPDVKIFHLNYTSGDRIAKTLETFKSEKGVIKTDSRTNTLIIMDLPENIKQIAALIEELDVEKPSTLKMYQTKIIPLSYAKVEDIQSNVQELLKKMPKAEGETDLLVGSTVTIHKDTNSIIINDLPENIVVIEKLLQELDRPAPQVMIEAKIVETTRNYVKSLGVQWGASHSETPASKDFPRINIGPTTGSTYLVDLPSASHGGLGLNIGHVLQEKFNLDMQLKAMEDNSHGKILANPKIATLDNKEAVIKSGTTIIVTYPNKEGQNEAREIEVNVKLTVTPHITPDDRVTMKIKAEKKDLLADLVDGKPSWSNREANTELIVNNGETAVIGGLFRQNNNNQEQGIPWLQRIPVLGWMFKNKHVERKFEELIIFITPQITRYEMVRQAKN
ncbi:MAG: secretin N-terminal domain-containing protein [bacterium]